MLVELGGGTNPHPRADVIIDLHHPRNAPAQDATKGAWLADPQFRGEWGWIGDGMADEVYASHFMEHVPHGQPLLDVMSEAHRVLKPGGTFTVIMPLIGYTDAHTGAPCSTQIGWQPWADPTHVSYWWLPEALWYFGKGQYAPNADYGYPLWKPLGPFIEPHKASELLDEQRFQPIGAISWWSVRGGWEGVAVMVKP